MDFMKLKGEKSSTIIARGIVLAEILVLLWWWIKAWTLGVVPAIDKVEIIGMHFSMPIAQFSWPKSLIADFFCAPIVCIGYLYLFMLAKSNAISDLREKLTVRFLVVEHVEFSDVVKVPRLWRLADLVFVGVLIILWIIQFTQYSFYQNFPFFCICCLAYFCWFTIFVILLAFAEQIIIC